MNCWGQGSCRGQPEVKLLRNAVWPPNLVGRTLDQSVTHCLVRGHAGVSQGQAEVKFFRNALWPPNLAERTPDQSVMHRWVKDHAGVSWGQPDDNCLEMLKAIKGSQCYKALCSCRYSSFTKRSQVNNYLIRYGKHLSLIKNNETFSDHSVCTTVPRIWYALENSLRASKSVKNFRSQLKQKLI